MKLDAFTAFAVTGAVGVITSAFFRIRVVACHDRKTEKRVKRF